MLLQTLQDIWLTSKEAKIYVAWLELGLAPISSIARTAKENRATTYGILKHFVQIGLAQEVKKNKVSFYIVVAPDNLIKIQKEKLRKLEDIMPELTWLMHTTGAKPKVSFYEGLEQVKQAFYQILETKESFRTFLGTQDIHPAFQQFLEQEFLPYRCNISTKARTIVSKADSAYAEFNRTQHDTVNIKDPVFDMANEIIIFDYNKVAICLYSRAELSVVFIHSQTLHDSLAGIFEILWKAGKKYKL